MLPQHEKTVALDFDGVLHSYIKGFTGLIPKDPPVPGAQKFVEDLILNGYDVVIFSHRAVEPEGQVGIQGWLQKWDFPENIAITATKPAAICYVDDRAFRFEGDFRQAFRFIESEGAEPWTTRK
jgi:hypothetical protein